MLVAKALRHEQLDQPAFYLIGGVPGYSLKQPVGINDSALRVHDEDGIRERLE